MGTTKDALQKEKNHTNVKRRIKPYYLSRTNSSTMSIFQLSVSYILRKKPLSKGKILDNKNFMKSLTDQNFCLQIDQIPLLKTLNDFSDVICICIFSRLSQIACT